MEIYFIDRKTGEKKKETVAGDRLLNWTYDTRVGKSLLEVFIKRKLFSSIMGSYMDLPYSKKRIPSFVQELELDILEADREKPEEYASFNDFFARKLKPGARKIDMDRNSFISPADGRVLAYENIDIREVIQVKAFVYSLAELFQRDSLAKEYDGGTCIVVRLCPADYHRFHFPADGVPGESIAIKGQYYSVSPIALGKVANIYCQNKREYTILKTEDFGEVVLMEVGATCVGSIIQTYEAGKEVKKGDEKGYFKFGGSTTILFIKKGMLKVDEDIIKNTDAGIETRVLMGERIGQR